MVHPTQSLYSSLPSSPPPRDLEIARVLGWYRIPWWAALREQGDQVSDVRFSLTIQNEMIASYET